MNYKKYRFEEKKKFQNRRKNQKKTQLKETKFRPGTEEEDYQVKLRSIRRFLESGNKVKATVRFRGREIVHKELGEALLTRLTEDLADTSQVEQSAKREGRQMFMVFTAKRSKITL